MSHVAQNLRSWLLQRWTALYLAAYLLAAGGGLMVGDVHSYNQWHELFQRPWMAVASVMFAMAVVLHAWVGIRDVLIDYVHRVWLRLSLMALTALLLLASLLWVVRTLVLMASPGAA